MLELAEMKFVSQVLALCTRQDNPTDDDVSLICAVLTGDSFYVIVFRLQFICGPPAEGDESSSGKVFDTRLRSAPGGYHMLTIRVLVASHIRLYREGLEWVLREAPE